MVCVACLSPYAVQAWGPALPVTATWMGSKVFSCCTSSQYCNTMAFPVPAISPAWSLFCQRALIQHKSFTHTRTVAYYTSGTSYICPYTHTDRQTQTLGCTAGPTLHSLIDAAKVFIRSVCFYSAQFICMLWDTPADLGSEWASIAALLSIEAARPDNTDGREPQTEDLDLRWELCLVS